MIVCRKCSRRHADGTEFCACGAYLQFDGEHVADPADPAKPASPAPAPSSSVSAPRPAPEPSPWSGLPGERAWGTPPSTAPPGVDARLPDVPVRTDTTEPMWVEPTGRAGDVPCPSCSTPNAPMRQFCRHCGHPLTGSAVVDASPRTVGRVSWWRRLGRDARRRAQQADPAAMANSARRLSSGGVGGRTVAFRTGAVTMILFGMLAFLGPWRGTVVAGARKALGGGDRFEQVERGVVRTEPIQTSPTIAPAEFPQQEAANVLDGYANTAWATRWLGTADPGTLAQPIDGECVDDDLTDTSLRFTFAEETDLAKVGILGGRHADDPARGLLSRPLVVELEVDGDCDHITLASEGELEINDFGHRDVTVVDLRIVDIAEDPEQSPTVEISEVVFGER